jgi:hypothetical protein
MVPQRLAYGECHFPGAESQRWAGSLINSGNWCEDSGRHHFRWLRRRAFHELRATPSLNRHDHRPSHHKPSPSHTSIGLARDWAASTRSAMSPPEAMLVADIGGTHARFALLDERGAPQSGTHPRGNRLRRPGGSDSRLILPRSAAVRYIGRCSARPGRPSPRAGHPDDQRRRGPSRARRSQRQAGADNVCCCSMTSPPSPCRYRILPPTTCIRSVAASR